MRITGVLTCTDIDCHLQADEVATLWRRLAPDPIIWFKAGDLRLAVSVDCQQRRLVVSPPQAPDAAVTGVVIADLPPRSLFARPAPPSEMGPC